MSFRSHVSIKHQISLYNRFLRSIGIWLEGINDLFLDFLFISMCIWWTEAFTWFSTSVLLTDFLEMAKEFGASVQKLVELEEVRKKKGLCITNWSLLLLIKKLNQIILRLDKLDKVLVGTWLHHYVLWMLTIQRSDSLEY